MANKGNVFGSHSPAPCGHCLSLQSYQDHSVCPDTAVGEEGVKMGRGAAEITIKGLCGGPTAELLGVLG